MRAVRRFRHRNSRAPLGRAHPSPSGEVRDAGRRHAEALEPCGHGEDALGEFGISRGAGHREVLGMREPDGLDKVPDRWLRGQALDDPENRDPVVHLVPNGQFPRDPRGAAEFGDHALADRCALPRCRVGDAPGTAAYEDGAVPPWSAALDAYGVVVMMGDAVGVKVVGHPDRAGLGEGPPARPSPDRTLRFFRP